MIADIIAAQSDVIRKQQKIIDQLFNELLQYKEANDYEDDVLAFLCSTSREAEDIMSST